MMQTEFLSIEQSIFSNPNNSYNLLKLEEPKKALKVDAFTQTTSEVATQTEFNDSRSEKINQVALKTIERAVQSDETPQVAKASYPLAHVNFEVISVTKENIDELDENLPEVAPYFEDAGEAYIEEEKINRTLFGKVLKGAANSLYWSVAFISNYVRTTFYRTENEILRDICKPHQKVRVSASWFFGGEREVLYGISQNSALQTRLFNVPKWLYYEGITSIFTSDQTAALKLFQVFPHVLEKSISDLNDQISQNVEVLARKAITVLQDESYDNKDFLSELESDLREELDRHLKASSEFIIHGMGEVKTGFKKVQIAINNQIEKAFPEGGGFLERQRYHIDALKVYSDRFFKIGDAIAQETIKAQDRFINESKKHLTDRIEDQKGRVYILIKELLKLRANAQEQLDQYRTILNEYNKIFES